MPRASMRQLLNEAAHGGYGAGAFHIYARRELMPEHPEARA